MAREHALLGNYETALIYFEGVASSIANYTRGCTDSTERVKWSKLKEAITVESQLIRQISQELVRWQRRPFICALVVPLRRACAPLGAHSVGPRLRSWVFIVLRRSALRCGALRCAAVFCRRAFDAVPVASVPTARWTLVATCRRRRATTRRRTRTRTLRCGRRRLCRRRRHK
jgi:hypothetical protein